MCATNYYVYACIIVLFTGLKESLQRFVNKNLCTVATIMFRIARGKI